MDESILYSSQEPITLGQNNQLIMTAPFNPTHPANPHYLPLNRSLVTPKNHYVEHFVKPESYIKYVPKNGPLLDLDQKDPAIQEARMTEKQLLEKGFRYLEGTTIKISPRAEINLT